MRVVLLPTVLMAALLYAATAMSQVDTAWVRIHDGLASMDDCPSALIVDGQGSAYVTGVSYVSESGAAYLTLKYDSGGHLAWKRTYNGTGDGFHRAFALGIDGARNIYVAGRSDGESTLQDYATLKYGPDGTLLWESRYSSTLGSSRDEARGLAIDKFGNLYVTGLSDCQGTSPLRTCDCVTIKYTSAGDTVWTRRYEGVLDYSIGIATDTIGNVFIAGSKQEFAESWDLVTLKYDTGGDQLWAETFDVPIARNEFSRGLAVADDGSVVVTGYSWIDGDSVTSDYITVMYSGDGTLQWARVFEEDKNQFGYTGSSDLGQPVQVDVGGNVFVTGRHYSTTDGYDCVTIKYDSSGNLQWQRRFDSPGSTWDEGYAIEVDSSGGVYVVGSSEMPGSSYDIIALKYSASGVLEWSESFNGVADGVDLPQAIRLDGTGNIYVAGCIGGGSPYSDYGTIKYTPVCRCNDQGDAEPDGFITSLDLAAMIDALFAEGNNPQDTYCPTYRFDLDCDDFTTALDLSIIIDHLFASGDGPCDPCAI